MRRESGREKREKEGYREREKERDSEREGKREGEKGRISACAFVSARSPEKGNAAHFQLINTADRACWRKPHYVAAGGGVDVGWEERGGEQRRGKAE